jgi:hypothetical protein
VTKTAIRSIQNAHQDDVYFVRDLEDPSHPLNNIAPGEDRSCNMTIPWCTSQTDFEQNHHIIIVPLASNVIPTNFYIWQDGDYVRFSTDGVFHSNGQLVPGNSAVGGNKNLTIEGTSIFEASLRLY